MKYLLMKFLLRINGGINFCFVCWGSRVSREQYVVISSGLAAVAYFFLGFAQRSLEVGRGEDSIFVFLVLTREWGSAISSRYPCLILWMIRFSTPPQVTEIKCVAREGERGVLNVGCLKCGGKVILGMHRIYTGLLNIGTW